MHGGKDTDSNVDLEIDNGMLSYKPSVVYLGAIISNTGSIKQDVAEYVESKRANVTIKFNNFCRKNNL